MDRKSQQNLKDARTYFNTDLTKDKKEKYKDHRIDDDAFQHGKQDCFNGNSISDTMKDNFSYISGFNHAKRELKIREDMYKMGQEYFLNGRDFEEAHENYKKNAYFVQGYKDAMDIKLENDTAIGRNGR